MSINFNFVEHYFNGTESFWSDLFISFIGAFFGLLFALLLNRWADNREKNKLKRIKENQDIERLRYLGLLLKSTLVTTQKHVKYFKELAGLVKENPYGSYMAQRIASDDIWRLKRLDSIELFDSYANIFNSQEDNKAEYKQLFGHADFIFEKMENAFKQNENHRNFQNKDELFIRDCIDEVYTRIGLRNKNYQKIYGEGSFQISEFTYLRHFEDIYAKFSGNFADFKLIRTEYLEPLHNTILDNIDDLNFADSLFAIIKKALNRFEHIKFNSIEFANDMENIEVDIQKAIRELDRQMIKIEEKIKQQRKLYAN